MMNDSNHSNAPLLPEPMELSEMELESVAGGVTPAFIPTTPWLWAGAAGAVAGAAALVLGTINEIEKDQAKDLEEEAKKRREGY